MREHGSVEPVREMGYDEIIRREKKPARGGIGLGATFTTTKEALLGPLLCIGRADQEVLFAFEQGDVEAKLTTDQELMDIARKLLRIRPRHETNQTLLPAFEKTPTGEAEFTERHRELSEERRGSWLAIPRLISTKSLWRESSVQRLRLDSSTEARSDQRGKASLSLSIGFEGTVNNHLWRLVNSCRS